ncbi:MAG: hypothetical protein Q8L04_03180 [Ignavibacteria bacterium]|nr:hypothetical protein [Ignavibacteria bacterium]
MNDLVDEIKKMNRLLALVLVKDLKTNDKFIALNDAGYQPKEIADLLNTTANTVRVTLSNARKKKK